MAKRKRLRPRSREDRGKEKVEVTKLENVTESGRKLRIAIMAGIRTRFSVVADQAAEEED